MILTFAFILASRYSQVFTDLEKSHSDLLVLDKMKDDFLATTTHELRTPLHGIIGLTESLYDGSLGRVNENQRENLGLIKNSAQHLNTLVGEILDFSKIRAGKADLYIEEIDLEEIINSIVSLMRVTLIDKDINIKTDIDRLPHLKADKNRIRQILMNLMGNAVKFTEVGSITVRARIREDRAAVISVEDTGTGITREDLSKIFTPFVQAQSVDTRITGGTGLGLAITKELVEMHGGRIWAESQKGKGSSFTFELPLEPVIRAISREAAPQHIVPETGMLARPVIESESGDLTEYRVSTDYSSATILAVDDDPVNMKVLENLCSLVGYNLITASTGAEALEVLKTKTIDLILLDLMLPGMSGFEVCQKIRSDTTRDFIPVIMVTARDQMPDMVKSFDYGANDYVTKPFSRQELLVRIENQLAIGQILDMEKRVITDLMKEKDKISSLFQRSMDLKESTLQMLEWEKIITEDLDIAHSFQMKLMTHDRKVPGIESHVYYRPLVKIGGDIYDIFEFKPGLLRVFLADATGHGISASLNTVKILSEYAAAKETLSSPRVLMDFMNLRFSANYRDYQIVFTCVIADIDLNKNTITSSSAGHPEMLIRSCGELIPFKPPGPLVGLTGSYSFAEETRSFSPGDSIFLYTDGLFELLGAMHNISANEVVLNPQFLRDKIKSLDTVKDPRSAVADLVGEKKQLLKKSTVDDDVTVIAIYRR